MGLTRTWVTPPFQRSFLSFSALKVHDTPDSHPYFHMNPKYQLFRDTSHLLGVKNVPGGNWELPSTSLLSRGQESCRSKDLGWPLLAHGLPILGRTKNHHGFQPVVSPGISPGSKKADRQQADFRNFGERESLTFGAQIQVFTQQKDCHLNVQISIPSNTTRTFNPRITMGNSKARDASDSHKTFVLFLSHWLSICQGGKALWIHVDWENSAVETIIYQGYGPYEPLKRQFYREIVCVCYC